MTLTMHTSGMRQHAALVLSLSLSLSVCVCVCVCVCLEQTTVDGGGARAISVARRGRHLVARGVHVCRGGRGLAQAMGAGRRREDAAGGDDRHTERYAATSTAACRDS